jgi:hypothetical protein
MDSMWLQVNVMRPNVHIQTPLCGFPKAHELLLTAAGAGKPASADGAKHPLGIRATAIR